MVGNLLLYAAICVIAFAVIWLAARLIGLDRPSRGPTGHAWLDADDDTLIGRVATGDDRPLLGDDRSEGVRRLRAER